MGRGIPARGRSERRGRGRVTDSDLKKEARDEDEDEDGEEKFQMLAGQDMTCMAWLLVSQFRKSLAEFEVKRSEKK